MKHAGLVEKRIFLLKGASIRSYSESVSVCAKDSCWLYNLILSAECCVHGNERAADQTAGSQELRERWMQMERLEKWSVSEKRNQGGKSSKSDWAIQWLLFFIFPRFPSPCSSFRAAIPAVSLGERDPLPLLFIQECGTSWQAGFSLTVHSWEFPLWLFLSISLVSMCEFLLHYLCYQPARPHTGRQCAGKQKPESPLNFQALPDETQCQNWTPMQIIC